MLLNTIILGSQVATPVTSPCISCIHPSIIGPHYSGLFELDDNIGLQYCICSFAQMSLSTNVPESESALGYVPLKTFQHNNRFQLLFFINNLIED